MKSQVGTTAPKTSPLQALQLLVDSVWFIVHKNVVGTKSRDVFEQVQEDCQDHLDLRDSQVQLGSEDPQDNPDPRDKQDHEVLQDPRVLLEPRVNPVRRDRLDLEDPQDLAEALDFPAPAELLGCLALL